MSTFEGSLDLTAPEEAVSASTAHVIDAQPFLQQRAKEEARTIDIRPAILERLAREEANVIDARPFIQEKAEAEPQPETAGKDAADRILARIALTEGSRRAVFQMLNSLPREEVDAAQAYVLSQIEAHGNREGSPYGYDLLVRLNESVLWRPRHDALNRKAAQQADATDLL